MSEPSDQATAQHAAVPEPPPAEGATGPASTPNVPPTGFAERGRMRRRLHQVRRLRELGLRDLGGLILDLHRFERDRPDLVAEKLATLTALDEEMRALETTLDERREVVVLHEAGLTACSRCGTLLGSDARFCSHCALPTARAAAGHASAPAAATPSPPQ